MLVGDKIDIGSLPREPAGIQRISAAVTWIKLDDTLPDHPRVAEAIPEAMWLYVAGLCYCSRMRTDGRIPKSQVLRLTSLPKVQRLQESLIEVGLWSDLGKEVEVWNYLKFQRSADEIDSVSKQRASAGRSGGLAKAKQLAKQTASKPPSKNLPDTDTDTEETKNKSFVQVDKSDLHHRPADWKPHEPILKLLESLEAASEFSLNGAKGLFAPEFWRRIAALTDGTKVFYDDELRKYVAWLAEQSPSNRHRNLQVGFSRWIRKEIAKESWQAKRKEFT